MAGISEYGRDFRDRTGLQSQDGISELERDFKVRTGFQRQEGISELGQDFQSKDWISKLGLDFRDRTRIQCYDGISEIRRDFKVRTEFQNRTVFQSQDGIFKPATLQLWDGLCLAQCNELQYIYRYGKATKSSSVALFMSLENNADRISSKSLLCCQVSPGFLIHVDTKNLQNNEKTQHICTYLYSLSSLRRKHLTFDQSN